MTIPTTTTAPRITSTEIAVSGPAAQPAGATSCESGRDELSPAAPAVVEPRGFIAVLTDLVHDSAVRVGPAAFTRCSRPRVGTGKPKAVAATYRGELEAHMRHLLGQHADPEVELTLASGLVLASELDKRLQHLPITWYPDLLWHVPGVLVNSLVIEVRSSRVSRRDLAKDIQRLTWFIGRDHRYGGAVLLLVGARTPSRACRRLLVKAQQAGIVVLLHERAGQRPVALENSLS